jgi:putative tricarboxylic transport membrane protein
MKAAPSEVALSAGVLALGIGAALVTAQLPSEGGYSHIGPNFFPAVISAGLILLGVWLFAEAFSGGGWRNRAERSPDELPFQRAAFGWVSAGLFIHMAAIGFAGFVLAGTALFSCVARGFGSARPARDAALGFVLSLAVHLFFVKLLNVSLPGGWLAPLLGTAGL